MQTFTTPEGIEYTFAFGYSQLTKELTQSVQVYRSGPGMPFSLPPCTTLVEPPEISKEHLVNLFDEDAGIWVTAIDLRAARLYAKATGDEVKNDLSIGETTPGSLTIIAPPDLRSRVHKTLRWTDEAGAWELLDDFSQTPLWRKDDGQLAPPIAKGQPLPEHLTTKAPPAFAGVGVSWDDEGNCWVTDPT